MLILLTSIGSLSKDIPTTFLSPTVRELQGDEKRNFERRPFNRAKRLMFPLFKALSIPVRRRFIKAGYGVRLTEALTNDFIAKNTTIPVPRIFDVFKYNGAVHIVQEFVDAPMLMSVWYKLGLEDRKRCMIQLRGYIDQLHALAPSEPGKIQSIDGSGFTDNRLGEEGECWGPFESHDVFHEYFKHDEVRRSPDHYHRAQPPLAATKGRVWRTVFAHGDLGPHNILWDTKRKEIAAIIDWEFAGWFPEYWDYTRVFFGPGAKPGWMDWWEMFQEHNKCYREELEVEIVLSDYFGRNI